MDIGEFAPIADGRGVTLSPRLAICPLWRAAGPPACCNPFELRPEPEPQHDPDSEYLRQAWEEHLLPLSRQMGVAISRPKVQPRTRMAHEAAA